MMTVSCGNNGTDSKRVLILIRREQAGGREKNEGRNTRGIPALHCKKAI